MCVSRDFVAERNDKKHLIRKSYNVISQTNFALASSIKATVFGTVQLLALPIFETTLARDKGCKFQLELSIWTITPNRFKQAAR